MPSFPSFWGAEVGGAGKQEEKEAGTIHSLKNQPGVGCPRAMLQGKAWVRLAPRADWALLVPGGAARFSLSEDVSVRPCLSLNYAPVSLRGHLAFGDNDSLERCPSIG